MPFGVLQLIAILISSYVAQKYRAKGITLTVFMIPALAGLIMIYVEANSDNFQPNVALAGYYLMAFIFGGNPLIVSFALCCWDYANLQISWIGVLDAFLRTTRS
jgi:hypothetical protein